MQLCPWQGQGHVTRSYPIFTTASYPFPRLNRHLVGLSFVIDIEPNQNKIFVVWSFGNQIIELKYDLLKNIII